jgi:filamentous hemagglutinin
MPRLPLISKLGVIESHYGAGGNEEYIPGAGPGTQGSTFVDITAVNDTTGKTVRVQTVDTLADGVTPTPREQAAIVRIREKYPDDELWIIPKRKTP